MSDISLVLGPGPYGERMIAALLEAGLLGQVIRYYPRFQVEQVHGDRLRMIESLRWHGALVRGVWAAWRRLPWLSRYETPRGPLCGLVDRLARRRLPDCRLLIGWSQVALGSLLRARRRGLRTLLEHPTSHVDAWMSLIEEECRRQRVAGAFSRLPRLLQRRMREECQAADRVCVLSSYSRRTFLAAGFPEARLVTLPLGVDAEVFSPGDRQDGPFRILYVGRLELLKGVHYLLEAFARLRFGDPHAELWLVGRVLPEMRPFLRRHARGVRVMGPLPAAELPRYYRLCDAFVLPTLCDAFGLVLLEAMTAGLPVIATDHSAAPDLIAEGVDGFVVPIRDPQAICDRLLLLRDDPDRRRAMGAAARQKVLSAYTWAHYGARLTALCMSLL